MPQPKLHWSAYLWPGLPQVWLRGSWVGLLLAVGFTALGNLLLATALVWDEWLPARARWIALGAMAVIWLAAVVEGRAEWKRLLAAWTDGDGEESDTDGRSDRWYREAQSAYLAGDWVTSEQTLLKLLKYDGRDAESRLMLATLWRHEGRFEAARGQLDQLERLETAAPWAYEIARERERICANCVQTIPPDPPENQHDIPAHAESSSLDSREPADSGGTQIAETNRRMAA